MRRNELEHIIRAVAAITDQCEFVVIGSQAILGAYPNVPDSLLQSIEVDIYPRNYDPILSDLIDGSIGESSPFQDRFGYYAQGVGPETAKLPGGWEQRLIKIQNASTDLKIGYCLEPHDLAAAKLAAGREKDYAFVKKMLGQGLADRTVLLTRVADLPVRAEMISQLSAWISACTLREESQSSRDPSTQAVSVPPEPA